MGPNAVEGIPDSCFPCFHDELVWQRFSDHSITTIFDPACVTKADFCGLYRVPEYWQVLHHQHLTQEESVHRCTHTRRDESLAVHYFDEEDISH